MNSFLCRAYTAFTTCLKPLVQASSPTQEQLPTLQAFEASLRSVDWKAMCDEALDADVSRIRREAERYFALCEVAEGSAEHRELLERYLSSALGYCNIPA